MKFGWLVAAVACIVGLTVWVVCSGGPVEDRWSSDAEFVAMRCVPVQFAVGFAAP